MSSFNTIVMKDLFLTGFAYVGSASITATKDDSGVIEVNEKGLIKYRYQSFHDFQRGYLMCGDVPYDKSELVGHRVDGQITFLSCFDASRIDDSEESNSSGLVYSTYIHVKSMCDPDFSTHAYVIFDPLQSKYLTPVGLFHSGEANAKMFTNLVHSDEQKSLISKGCEVHYLYDPEYKENDGLITIDAVEVNTPYNGCLEITLSRAMGKVTRYFDCRSAALRSLYNQCMSHPKVIMYSMYEAER